MAPATVMTIQARIAGGAHHRGLRFKTALAGNSAPVLRVAVAASSRRGGADRATGLRVSAVFERFTERAIKSVMLAQQEAKAKQHTEVTPVHLFLGLVAEETNSGDKKFLGTNITAASAREAATEVQPSEGKKRSTSEVPFSRGSKRVFEEALEEMGRMGMNYIAPEHISLALISMEDAGVLHILRKLGVSTEAIQKEINQRLRGEMDKDKGPGGKGLAAVGSPKAGKAQGGSGANEEKTVIQEFCTDLTQNARDGKTDPVIGRDEEVERTIQILARRTKNNPILLGEPGVGKTAIAEGLALRIAAGNVPEFLLDKRVMALDVGLLMAGAKERGELEQRITSLMAEVTESSDVILLIDEVHTVVGAGSVGRGGGGGGGLDISNMLKPALARGELQCIGATTLDEHRKYIEKDAALERRFQPVIVNEPTEEESFEILYGLRPRYERHHGCVITDEALSACVRLSSRYIADRYLPDKAIDLMDEAGSRARIAGYLKQQAEAAKSGMAEETAEVLELWRELKQVSEAKDAAVKALLFEEATLLREREREMKDTLREKGAIVDTHDSIDDRVVVDVDVGEIELVASSWTGIPVQQLTANETERLVNLDSVLHERVVGQNEAVEAIARAMRRARCGLKDPERPIASMLFSGPTGVGKTELTKALADQYFGSEESMVRLDMSEYMERHSVSKLVGAPPGYVGFGEGGTLTEAVRRRPFTIVLLDEIEKAHPDIFNVLLQVMEDGRLTDSQGRTVSFKNTLIIMTSNIGSNVIAKGGGGLGFYLPEAGESKEEFAYGRIRSLVMEELRSYFRPELLNRLDEVVVFRPLEEGEVREIADFMLAESANRLKDLGIGMQITESMMTRLLSEGYDRAYGARPMRRAITQLIDDNLSEALLSEEIKEGDVVVFDCHEDGCVEMSPKTISPERQIVFSSGVDNSSTSSV